MPERRESREQEGNEAAGARMDLRDSDLITVLSEGRLMNLGNATGHPCFVMWNSFSNETIAQIELFGRTDEYLDEWGEPKAATLPKHLDE